jgi:hypothetical protein
LGRVACYFEDLESSVRTAAKAVIDGALAKLKTITGDSLKITSEIIQGPPGPVFLRR